MRMTLEYTLEHTLHLLKFGADWCEGCQRQTLSLQQANVLFDEVDVDQHPTLAQQYKIRTLPTLILLQNQQEVYRWAGVTGAGKIQAKMLDFQMLKP